MATEKGIQETTKDKYKLIAKARSMSHGDLTEHVQNHMLSCSDPDCDICDLGQSAQMIDDDDEGSGEPLFDKGTRSSKDWAAPGDIYKKGREAQGSIVKASDKILKARYNFGD